VTPAFDLDEVVLATPHFRLFRVVDEAVVVVRRTRLAFGSRAEVRDAFAALLAGFATQGAGGERWGMVVDAREAAPNNDPQYEALWSDERAAATRHFGHVVVVVRSAVSALQVRRLQTADGLQGASQRVMHDVDAAIAALVQLQSRAA
jgi:hypothetical protein